MSLHEANATGYRVVQTNPAIGDCGHLHVDGADPATKRIC